MTSISEMQRVDRYPTRVDEPAITPRRDPVVYGTPHGPLDAALVQSFDRDGCIVVEGVFDREEVEELDQELQELSSDPDVRDRPGTIVEPTNDELRSVFGIHTWSDHFKHLSRDRRLVTAARQLLGSDVYLHQSRANLKSAFRGQGYSWHADFEMWHAEDGMPSPRAVSCSIHLNDNHEWNGPLLTVAGSHRWFIACAGETPPDHYQQAQRNLTTVGAPDDASVTEVIRRGRIIPCLGRPGTVVFFDSNLLHGSNSNITPDPRRNLFVVYNSMKNTLVEPYSAPAPRPEFVASRTFEPI